MSESNIDKVIDALAKKLGTSRENILKALAETVLKQSSGKRESLSALKELSGTQFFKSSMTIDDIFRYRLMEKLMSDDEGLDLNKILAIGMLKQLFQPDPMTLLLIQRMAENPRSDDKVIQLLLQQQQQQQQLMMTLLTAIMGKKQEELVQQVQQQMVQQQEQLRAETDEKLRRFAEVMSREIEELKKDRSELAQYFKQLAETVKNQPNAMQILINAIQQYKALQQALQDAAKELGLKPQEIPVTREGKIDWAKLLNRVLDIAEEYVKIQAGQQQQAPPPPVQQIEELPPQAPVQQQEVKVEEAPKEAKVEEKSEAQITVVEEAEK